MSSLPEVPKTCPIRLVSTTLAVPGSKLIQVWPRRHLVRREQVGQQVRCRSQARRLSCGLPCRPGAESYANGHHSRKPGSSIWYNSSRCGCIRSAVAAAVGRSQQSWRLQGRDCAHDAPWQEARDRSDNRHGRRAATADYPRELGQAPDGLHEGGRHGHCWKRVRHHGWRGGEYHCE